MTSNPLRAVLCTYVLVCFVGWAQQPPAQQDAPPVATPPAAPAKPAASATIPPPREVPSEINTGRGASIQPLYWLSTLNAKLGEGNLYSRQPSSGALDIARAEPRSPGFLVNIPVSRTNMIRVSYFQMPRQFGRTTTPVKINLFTAEGGAGDPVLTATQVTGLKFSFDYLTYFVKRGNTELRVKTLWEIQRVGAREDVDVFLTQPNGAVDLNSQGRDFNIIYPTIGIGLEHTLGRHFRWEAKASGMTFGGQKAAIGDGDANIAVRFGHFEFVGGGRFLYFRTTRKNDHLIQGTMYGPYAGIRYYFRRERPTAPATAPTGAAPSR